MQDKWNGTNLRKELDKLQEKLDSQRQRNAARDLRWFALFGYQKLPWNRPVATRLRPETEKTPRVQRTESMRPLHGIETVQTILLNNAIADIETQRMQAVRPIQQTESIPPQRPHAKITDIEGPIEKRIEYRLPGEKLSKMMLGATLFYSCKYETAPSMVLMSQANYTQVLPFLRTQTAYEYGYPLDESGNITIPYAIDDTLDDYTIACTGQ